MLLLRTLFNCFTSRHSRFFLGMLVLLGPTAQAAPSTASWAAAIDNPGNKIVLFTHGDTPLLLPDKSGTLKGPALDVFKCAMMQLQYPFTVQKAPLSRARRIISELNNAVWFPSALRGDADRMARSIGPTGTIDIYWYQSKTNPLDPNSDMFKQSATVTTYKGSAMEHQLRSEGYRFTEGSADRNRLVYMLLNGQVDAFAAVDFRDQISNEMRQKLSENADIMLKEKIPAAFLVSDRLFKSQPEFTSKFRAAFQDCLAKG